MNPFDLVFAATVTLAMFSGAAATAVVIVVDTRTRPGARVVAIRLIEIAVLAAGAAIALASGQ